MNITGITFMLDMLSAFRQFRAREHWTRERLETYQAQALRSLRDSAYANSPFYQQFHQGLYDAPLQELPVLTKAMLMDHFDDLVTDRAIHLADAQAYLANRRGDERFLGRYLVNGTSGSTGQPGVFLATNAEWLTILASLARGLELAGIKVKLTRRIKTAMIASPSPFHMSISHPWLVDAWTTSGSHREGFKPRRAPQCLAAGTAGCLSLPGAYPSG